METQNQALTQRESRCGLFLAVLGEALVRACAAGMVELEKPSMAGAGGCRREDLNTRVAAMSDCSAAGMLKKPERDEMVREFLFVQVHMQGFPPGIGRQ